LKKNLSVNATGFLLVSLMFITSLTIVSPNIAYAQESMTFTSGEKINFTSTEEMTFIDPESMTFGSNVSMIFGSGIRMKVVWFSGQNPYYLEPCTWINVTWPEGFLPEPCSWWEAIDPNTGKPLGEFHIDGHEPPSFFHIDEVFPQQPIPVPEGGVILAEMKIHTVEPCAYYEVHWPSHWWPEPCTWWEIVDPDTGELTGYEFHVDWTNESCEFHIDIVIPEPWGPWYYGAWEIEARKKIPDIKPCDYFVVEDPVDWWPEPCTWWEVIDPYTGEPSGYEFHVDWTNESCEFHVDEVYPDPSTFPWFPPTLILTAWKKIIEIETCDWFIIVDPIEYLPDSCSWWEILDDTGEPTGFEFHVDVNDGYYMFHVDATMPGEVITIPPSYSVTVRKKIDIIEPCQWFRVDDPVLTPESCSWWEILDDTGEPTGIEFHVDQAIPADGWFHIDEVLPDLSIDIPPIYMLTAEKKIDDIKECDWFKVLDPPHFVPEPCSWWVITWPPVWAGTHFHVDANDDVDMFHIDDVNGGGPPPPPPPPPPWNVTAIPYEPPPLPWYMKASYPDYVPSGMPDFDERQWGTYIWQDGAGRWSHCGPCAVANSMWWLDSEFETNTVPPPAVIDTYPLVQAYAGPPWDDHDPLNVPWLVEHLAYLMDTDGLRTGLVHSGTNVFDMEAGITHYLSWSGVNPLGDVDGDGNVTQTDADIVTAAMGTSPGIVGWDLRADIFPVTMGYPPMADNVIDFNDLSLVTMYMGMNGSFYEHTVMAPWWEIIVEEVEKCQDVVLLIAPWYYDGLEWYRYEEDAHFVTVAGLNATTWEIVFSDPILDNAEAGGYGDVPVPHIHPPPEPPYITHNNASLVSHDAYHVIVDPCLGGPLTIPDYPRGPGQYPEWRWQIEAAVITSPYVVAVHDVAVTNVTTSKTGCTPLPTVGKGYTAKVYVTVENQGDFNETFTVTAYANLTVIDSAVVNDLTPDSNTTLTLTWDTTAFAKGNYTISAYATPVPSETDTIDNTFIDGSVLVTIAGDANGDRTCDMADISMMIDAFMTTPGNAKWDPNCDVNDDDSVDMADISIAIDHFMEAW
jgi:hypothetical protein